MKLLSIKLTRHDSNISYFDGDNLRYIKSERLHNHKHYRHSHVSEWKDEIKKVWDLNHDELDEICLIFDPEDFDLPTSDFSDILVHEYFDFPSNCRVWHIDHHYAHALSTWTVSDTKPNIHFVLDGEGNEKSWSIFKNDSFLEKDTTSSRYSIGHRMFEGAQFLHIMGNELDAPSKLMGLQSYGVIDEDYLSFLRKDNSYDMSNINKIFDYENWVKYKGDDTIARLTGLDLSKTIHKFMEEFLVGFFSKYADKQDVISFSGGIAQNVVWNTALRKHFPNLIVSPHSADDGLSLGGIEWLRIKNNLPRFKLDNFPYIQSDENPSISPSDKIIFHVAKKLSEGKIVAWYQDNGEIGPRALGNRSILMDPRIPDGKKKINTVKNRENYRPFGASVLKEHQSKYFDHYWDDEYMLYVSKVKTDIFPSITHVDRTCRLQTVGDNNPVFRKLLEKFYSVSGCPVLLNTSFNMAGKPICSSIEESVNIFNNTNIDILVVGNTIYHKEDK